MKKKNISYKAFNIYMPPELIPLYNYLQDEMNIILKNSSYRKDLVNLDLTKHRGNLWLEMRDILKTRINNWTIHNKTWHSYILFENLRRELASRKEARVIYQELQNNNGIVDQDFYDACHSQSAYPTAGTVRNISKMQTPPKLAEKATFVLDYSISEKQFFRMKDKKCFIKVSKRGWIEYNVEFPDSIDPSATGVIAKPRFVKRKRDGVYIGACSYAYVPKKIDGVNILGVDLGKVKPFSAVMITPDGDHSQEFTSSRVLDSLFQKEKNLYEQKHSLRKIAVQHEKLELEYSDRTDIISKNLASVGKKIVNLKVKQAELAAVEIVYLAQRYGCKTVHIEDLSWLDSVGGKWNHSAIKEAVLEEAKQAGVRVVEVPAAYSSSEHPITKERGVARERFIYFEDGTKIDRDLLGDLNIAIRESSIQLNKIKPNVRTQKVKRKVSNKKALKDLIQKKAGSQIVVPAVGVPSDSDDQVGTYPLTSKIYNSLLNKKLQL